jgi:hypothetical protein
MKIPSPHNFVHFLPNQNSVDKIFNLIFFFNFSLKLNLISQMVNIYFQEINKTIFLYL